MGMNLKGWGGVLVLTGAGLLALPWIDGYLFKQQYVNYLTAATLSSKVKISLEEYHQGWLNSEAKVSVQFVPAPGEAVNPMNGVMPDKIVLDQKITHGPLVRNPFTQRWTIAMAAVNTHFHLSPEIEGLLLGTQANEGIIQIAMIAKFGGKYVNQFKMPVISKTIPQVGSFTWQGLNGSSSVEMMGSVLGHAEVNMTIGALTAQSPQGSLSTKDMTLKYDLTPEAGGLWSGSSHFVVPQITANSPAGNFNLSNLQLINAFHLVNNQYNVSLQTMLGQLDWPNYSFSQSNLNISLNNVNAPALMTMMKAAMQLQGRYLTEQQYQQYYSNYVPALFTPTTVLSYSSTINSSYGHLVSDGQVQWPAGVKQVHDLAANANAKVNLRVSMALVNRMIDVMNEKTQQVKAAHSSDASSADQFSEQQLAKNIDALATAGKMEASTSEKLKDLIHTHIAVANFNLNIDEYVQRKELTDDIGVQLKAQYAMLIDPTKRPAHPQAVSQAAQSSPPEAEQMKQQLNALVQQGYLTVDKDDYVTVLTVEQGVFKANGHAVMNGGGTA